MSLLDSSHFARDLARLLAGWLAVIVCVQAMAAALGLVQGPRHVHVRSEAVAPAAFVHADLQHDAEHHEHGGWARHVHLKTVADPVLGDEAQDLGAAASLVLSAMVALDTVRDGVRLADTAHVMRASRAWSCITHALSFPERPPRA
jgi:hypothetical protein